MNSCAKPSPLVVGKTPVSMEGLRRVSQVLYKPRRVSLQPLHGLINGGRHKIPTKDTLMSSFHYSRPDPTLWKIYRAFRLAVTCIIECLDALVLTMCSTLAAFHMSPSWAQLGPIWECCLGMYYARCLTLSSKTINGVISETLQPYIYFL